MLRAKDVTPDIEKRAQEIARKIKRIIEKKFTRKMAEEEHLELRNLRQQLSDMGFFVEIDYNLELEPTVRLKVDVKLFVLRDNVPSA